MRTITAATSRAAVAAALILTMVPAAAPAAPRAASTVRPTAVAPQLAVLNDIPGDPLPEPPVSGPVLTADGYYDPPVPSAEPSSQVYWTTLARGEKLSASVVGAADTDFDVYIHGPDATSVETAAPLAFSTRGKNEYPDPASWTADKAGTYYVEVHAWTGSGSFTLDWSKSAGDADDYLPGGALPASPFSDTMDVSVDAFDYYQVTMKAGDRMVYRLTSSTGNDFTVWAYPPGVTSFLDANAVPVAWTEQEPYAYPQILAFRAAKTGAYSLANVAIDGTGAYDVTYVHDALTLSGPASVAWGASATIGGKLTRNGAAWPGRAVQIQRLDGTTWKTLKTVYSNTSGNFSYSFKPAKPASYRALLAGSPGVPAVLSPTIAVAPRAYLTAPVAQVKGVAVAKVKAGAPFNAVGFLKPRHPAGTYHVTIAIYKKINGSWVLQKTRAAKNYDYSTYTKYVGSISLPSAGEWKLNATVPADSLHAKTSSSARYITAY